MLVRCKYHIKYIVLIFFYFACLNPVLLTASILNISYENELSVIAGNKNISELVKMKKLFLSKDEHSSFEILKQILVLNNLTNYGAELGYQNEIFDAALLIEDLKKQEKKTILPYIEVLQGFNLTLMGRETWNPIKKITFVQDGLVYLHNLKKYYSNSYFIPLICGNVFLSLPNFFEQEEKALKTFLFMEKKFGKTDSEMPLGVKCNVYSNLALLYKKRKKIKKTIFYLKKAVLIFPESQCAKDAEYYLNELVH